MPAHCRPNQKPNKTEPTTVMSGPVPDFIWLGLVLPKFAKNKLKPTDAHPCLGNSHGIHDLWVKDHSVIVVSFYLFISYGVMHDRQVVELLWHV